MIPAMSLSTLAAVKPAQIDAHLLSKGQGPAVNESFATSGPQEVVVRAKAAGDMDTGEMDARGRIAREKAGRMKAVREKAAREIVAREQADRETAAREIAAREMDAVLEDTKLIRRMLQGAIKSGASDPMAAAREAVSETKVRQFDSRRAALADALRSASVMARAARAERFSLGNIASAEAAREGATADRLSSIDHVVATEMAYISQLMGKISVTAALLERDFTVTGKILDRDKTGATTLGEFELSHEVHGRLLSVDGQESVTVYDQQGEAMPTEDYMKALFGGADSFALQLDSRKGVVIDHRL